MPADELVQHVRIGDHFARVVRRGLVHRLLHADLHAHAVVLLVQDLRRLCNVTVFHDSATERRVLLGCKILHPVRPLMADDLHHGILRVLCNADLIALDDAVSRAAAHLVSHAHAHAKRLCDGVDLVCRRAVHLAGNVFVIDKAAAALAFLRKRLLARLGLCVVLPCDIACIGRLIRRVRVCLALHARIVGRDKVLHVLRRVLALLIRATDRLAPALTDHAVVARKEPVSNTVHDLRVAARLCLRLRQLGTTVIIAPTSVADGLHATAEPTEDAADEEVVQNFRCFQLAIAPAERLAVIDNLQGRLNEVFDGLLAALFKERQRDLARRAVIEPRHRALDDAI